MSQNLKNHSFVSWQNNVKVKKKNTDRFSTCNVAKKKGKKSKKNIAYMYFCGIDDEQFLKLSSQTYILANSWFQ